MTKDTYFNSIKVRLERCCATIRRDVRRFQFHKGTIRTQAIFSDTYIVSSFQFHKGTIRTTIFVAACFAMTTFQFHKGTIRTKSYAARSAAVFSFQFHKGTIRTDFIYSKVIKIDISIP